MDKRTARKIGKINKCEDPEKLKRLFLKNYKRREPLSEVCLAVINRFGEIKNDEDTQLVIRDLIEGRNTPIESSLLAEFSLLLDDDYEKQHMIKKWTKVYLAEPKDGLHWEKWLAVVGEPEMYKKFANKQIVRESSENLFKLAQSAPDRHLAAVITANAATPQIVAEVGNNLNLSPVEWLVVLKNCDDPKVQNEAIKHTDIQAAHYLSSLASEGNTSAQEHLARIAPAKYPQHIMILDEDDLSETAKAMTQDAIYRVLKENWNDPDRQKLNIFFENLTDSNQLKQFLVNFKFNTVPQKEYLTAAIEKLADRPDILTEVLVARGDCNGFSSALDYIDDDEQLFVVAGSRSTLAAKAADKLPLEYMEKLTKKNNSEVKILALINLASTDDERFAIKSLWASVKANSTGKLLAKTECEQFALLGAEPAFVIFSECPKAFYDKALMSMLKDKFSGTEYDEKLTKLLEAASRTTNKKWVKGNTSISVDMLAMYEGISLGEAAREVGLDSFLKSRLINAETAEDANTYAAELKKLYGNGDDAEKMLAECFEKLMESTSSSEIKLYALKNLASSYEERDAINKLSQKHGGDLTGAEMLMFLQLSPKLALQIFLITPKSFLKEGAMSEVKNKFIGTEYEAELIGWLEAAMFLQNSTWVHSESRVSLAAVLLAKYDGISHGAAAWKHGKTKYINFLERELIKEKDTYYARQYIDEMKSIYRDSAEGASVLKAMNGTTYRKHDDWQFFCYSDNVDKYRTITIDFSKSVNQMID